MRRISRIEVKNFKSLVDFTIDLPKFSCLIGLNGSGKSTVLQLIDFLSQLSRGNMKQWLDDRNWDADDLKSKFSKKMNIEFTVWFCDEHDKSAGYWEAIYNPIKHHCTEEIIALNDFSLIVKGDEVVSSRISDGSSQFLWKFKISFNYEGSILSALREEILRPSIFEIKNLFQNIRSLDMLSPEHLRQRTREAAGTLGIGGQNLASFLHEMSQPKRAELISKLKKIYPQLSTIHARSLRSGWKQLEIGEVFGTSTMITEARHVNDGMLRLIAILAEIQSDDRFLLFDEIENGINPEVVEFLVDELVNAKQQVLITTHSPMILNFMEDETARQSVIYLYKTPEGLTKAISFFEIPSLREKLTVMGPGEAFVDTSLTELASEIMSLPKPRESV